MFLNHDDDAVSKAGEVHKTIFENDAVRVLNVIVPVGAKTAQHWHPKNMCYIITGGRMRYTLADGIVKDVELTKDQVTEGAGVHIVENIGDTEVRVIQVEFKK
jgi:quercetin dioxygenase-like cupin family protein